MKLPACGLLLAMLVTITPRPACTAPVEVPQQIDHSIYDRLLRKYVDDRGLVDYVAWKASTGDGQALKDYVGKFAGGPPLATGDDQTASLINAYNALTLEWILENYPTKSIRDTPEPWKAKRHKIGGRAVSLDELEHDTLRPLVGYRVHATLVCGAKSCPPLRAAAYQPANLNAQLDDAMRRWLGRSDLNKFLPANNRVVLSPIFNWFRDDFDKAGGVRAVLAKYAPAADAALLKERYEISFAAYDWTLNERHQNAP